MAWLTVKVADCGLGTKISTPFVAMMSIEGGRDGEYVDEGVVNICLKYLGLLVCLSLEHDVLNRP